MNDHSAKQLCRKPVEKKPAAMPAATMSSTKSSFSFADTMANLNKPKAKETTPKLEEPKLTETAVEKKKRLRKEMRRSLRVTFRPESSLVEVRYFTHDPEEELGHDASMMRDVSDVGGEGRMFKQHQDAMDLDEEDDEPSEVELHQYRDPVSVDFSTVEKDERDRNYAPYGGGMLVPESAEKDTREQHEATTLMVFYTHKSDIPPSPKEPTDPYNGDTIEVKEFGSPSSVVLVGGAFCSYVTLMLTTSRLELPNSPKLRKSLPNLSHWFNSLRLHLISLRSWLLSILRHNNPLISSNNKHPISKESWPISLKTRHNRLPFKQPRQRLAPACLQIWQTSSQAYSRKAPTHLKHQRSKRFNQLPRKP